MFETRGGDARRLGYKLRIVVSLRVYPLGCTRANNKKTLISVSGLISADPSGTRVGSSSAHEQWLVIEAIPFVFVSFRGLTKLVLVSLP